MIIDFIMYLFAGEMMLFGLFTFLFGPKRTWNLMHTGKKEPFIIMAAVMIAICYWGQMPVPLIIMATLVFSAYLWWKKIDNIRPMELMVRGTLSAAMSMAMTIFLGYYYYVILERNNAIINEYNRNVVTVCMMQICLFFMFINVVWESIADKDKTKKIIYGCLTMKAGSGIFWLPKITGCPFFIDRYIFNEFVICISVILDYAVFFIVVMQYERDAAARNASIVQKTSYEYYLQMEEEHLKVRRLYHDLKNQLMVLNEVPGEMSEALKQMVETYNQELKGMEKFYHTGCNSLDMLLFDTERRGAEKGIEFDVVISENCLGFMTDTDISLIFTNLLKNAMEACDKIQSGEKKISVRAGKNREDVMVYVKNTVDADHVRGSLKTKKKNKMMHGIGLSSVLNIVEKYGGYMSIRDDDGFQVTMLFSRGKEENEKNQ